MSNALMANFCFFGAVLLAAGVAPAADKVLTSFENAADLSAWTGGKVVRKNAADGSKSYLIKPGAKAVFTDSGDWSAYRHLKMDVFNPGAVIMVNFRAHDQNGRAIMAFEYNFYSGKTTQHIRIDALRNNFGVGEGIDTRKMKKLEIVVRPRRKLDREIDGVYIDNIRLSKNPTESYVEPNKKNAVALKDLKKPAGFVMPEFAGFEAGYHTWTIDPSHYQLLCRLGTGRDGKGRALEFKPLDVNHIKIWDAARRFPKTGTYVVNFWAKGPAGAVFKDYSNRQEFRLTKDWKQYTYEFNMNAGGVKRFVLEMRNLGGKSAFMDDLTVVLKGSKEDLTPKSRAKGKPTVVTYADGISYINGRPTFILGFMRGNPDKMRGTPFNFCGPQELLQPSMEFMDKCAEYGLYTSVNLTSPTRAVAPESAAYFVKYKDHPALFTYYLCDEPDHASPSATSEAPVLARCTEILHELDPNHPTQALVIPWCASNIYRYRDVVDMLSADRYAVKGTANNTELWTVYRANVAMRESATEGQVNIFTPKAQPNITREENWAQAYMCVAAGAGGIMWFEFGGAQRKWNDFVELGKELMSIENFLVGTALEKGLKFENDVLAEMKAGRAVHRNFKQIRGIGRATEKQTALITVNLTPSQASDVKITAPFLAHAKSAKVMFENRSVKVGPGGVIVDSFAGLERHVYVVDGVPRGVKPRPVPRVGGTQVSDAGSAWKSAKTAEVKKRSSADLERSKYIETRVKKAEAYMERGRKDAARRVYWDILKQYPDAQEIRERLRTL